MPSTRFQLIKRKDVDQFIGKARINSFIFYLIKWKAHLEKSISWQPTSMMGNMGKFLSSYNTSIEGQMLPYIQSDYLNMGLQLLDEVNEKQERQKRMWKVQKIIGKRRLNGYIYYFMKWKHISIFQSDWIAQKGLWRLYPEELKQCKAKLMNLPLPFTDTQSLDKYIEAERIAFERDQQPIANIYENSKIIKQRKQEAKDVKNEHIVVKKEFSTDEKREILKEFITELKNKFLYPMQKLYLKHQYHTKREKLQFQQKDQLYTNEMSYQKDFKEEAQIKKQTLKNKIKRKIKANKFKAKTLHQDDFTPSRISKLKKIDKGLQSSYEQAIRSLPLYLINLEPKYVYQGDNSQKIDMEKKDSDLIKEKKNKSTKIKSRQIEKQRSAQIDQTVLISSNIKKYPLPRTLPLETSKQQQQVLKITLFAQKIPKIISYEKSHQQQTQNLYRVLMTKQKENINLSEDQTVNESIEPQISQNFYLTSFLAQRHPKQLIQYLEKENAKLRAISNQSNKSL